MEGGASEEDLPCRPVNGLDKKGAPLEPKGAPLLDGIGMTDWPQPFSVSAQAEYLATFSSQASLLSALVRI